MSPIRSRCPKAIRSWKFDNAIVTPHIAGRSNKDNARMNDTVKAIIKRFAEGKPPINGVDKAAGN